MDEIDKKIINELQGGFPVCDSPYQVVALQLGISESELIKRIKCLLELGVLSRFGPLYHAEKMGGGLTLAAVKVSADDFDRVSTIINSFPEVAHNYERTHQLNMWFVIATDEVTRVLDVIKEIEIKTGLNVYNMPKKNEYFVGLKFDV